MDVRALQNYFAQQDKHSPECLDFYRRRRNNLMFNNNLPTVL